MDLWYFDVVFLSTLIMKSNIQNFPKARTAKPDFRDLDTWYSRTGICIRPQPTWEAGRRECSHYWIPTQWCCLYRISLGLCKLKLIWDLLAEKALRGHFVLELLQHYSRYTDLGTCSSSFQWFSFFSSKCGKLQSPRMEQGSILQFRSLIEQSLSNLRKTFRFSKLIFFYQYIVSLETLCRQ